MARTKQPTTEPIVPTVAEVEAANDEAARAVVRADAARALAEAERLERMQAVARECGYALADSLFTAAEVVADVQVHLQLHEQQQAAADASLFRVGQGLMVLREGCAHGEWLPLLAKIGFTRQHAARLIRVAQRFSGSNDVSEIAPNGTPAFHLPAPKFPALTSADGPLRTGSPGDLHRHQVEPDDTQRPQDALLLDLQ